MISYMYIDWTSRYVRSNIYRIFVINSENFSLSILVDAQYLLINPRKEKNISQQEKKKKKKKLHINILFHYIHIFIHAYIRS